MSAGTSPPGSWPRRSSADADQVSLFIDAGTNGEIVVGNRDWLVTCACSAGPAFEGGGTKCGLPATEGAIEEIRLSADAALDYSVIGGGLPKGLCGSGLVDLLAELFVHGFIDRQGKLDADKVGRRLWRSDGQTGFVVEEAERSYLGQGPRHHRERHRQPDPEQRARSSRPARSS